MNAKFLSIPPYVSTSWRNIRTLRMEEHTLLITLLDNSIVRVPNLEPPFVDQLFAQHATYLEEQASQQPFPAPSKPESVFRPMIPPNAASLLGKEAFFRLGSFGPEGFAEALQHDPAHAGAPDLPREILEKVATVSKIMAPGDPNMLPKAEPHCNCVFCQLARAIRDGVPLLKAGEEAEILISNEELTFKEWEIKELSLNVYEVANPLNSEEYYKVCLDPVGCTCGQANCSHILAVLRS